MISSSPKFVISPKKRLYAFFSTPPSSPSTIAGGGGSVSTGRQVVFIAVETNGVCPITIWRWATLFCLLVAA